MTRKLRQIACELEGRITDRPFFDIVHFLDVTLAKYSNDYMLEFLTVNEMQSLHGDAHAMAFPADQLIQVREDIWKRAEAGHGRDRLTLAHELGHLFLHGKPGYARKMADSSVKPYRQSEWQSDAFGGELLVAAHFIQQCKSVRDVARLFGVSDTAAAAQWRAFQKDGLV
ncbi:ImmA/IrrE family metallo-endopeptidase [Thiobaca trueperi]|nr:ImmA/IrrE family metallo-endopeptidase [Thiobaca trueperi]